MQFSKFGSKFAGRIGIAELMDDLGTALNENPQMIFMGGGNPGRIDAIEQRMRVQFGNILNNTEKLHSMLGVYQSMQGEKQFLTHLADLLAAQFGWEISAKNIAISNGSQAAFFILYNLFAGDMPDGSKKTIHLPLSPEYVGYADIGLTADFFSATKPSITELDNGLFKYNVNFDELVIDEQVGAISVSRPTNPTGNVLSDAEMQQLDALAKAHNIPFIVDGAYGLPFPNIIFGDAKPDWNSNTVLVLSLSKLGLPGVRTGIVIANEDLIRTFSVANATLSLACGNLGPALTTDMIASGEILALSKQHVQPFYAEKMQFALDLLRAELANLPMRIHKPEGAIFLWLWFKDLPISSDELYQRLKARGVLVIPGEAFFVGLDKGWQHTQECLRVSYAQPAEVVKAGVTIIAEEVRNAYQQAVTQG